MEVVRIPSIKNGLLETQPIFAFIIGNKALLIGSATGTTLCVVRSCAEQLMRAAIDDGFAFLLVQRGLAYYDKSRGITDVGEIIMPSFFLLDMTKSCNLKCVYCFRELEKEPQSAHCEMTDYQLETICNALIHTYFTEHLDHMCIQAWGGEPIIELRHIKTIRRRFSEKKLHPQIVVETNATLITPEIAYELYNADVQIGISIDGHAPVHNAQRPFASGSPSLSKVERGIANLRAAGFQKFGTITVVTKNTAEHLPDIFRYFTSELKLQSVKFNLMRKTDRNRNLALELREIDTYAENLLKCLRHCYNEGVQIREQNISQRLANLLFRPCDNICNSQGCRGGYQMLSIDAMGYVYPCELSDDPTYRIGRIGEAEFSEMVRGAIEKGHAYFNKRDMTQCLDCPWYFYCRGGCKAAVKYDCKDSSGIDKTECTLNRALYPRLVEILLTDEPFAKYLLKGGF